MEPLPRFFFSYDSTPVSEERVHSNLSPVREKSEPVVSIVTPFFNTGEIFLETVLSIFQQSLIEFEWIIVDDDSDSEVSTNLLNSADLKDPRVKIVRHKVNRGCGAGRNTGAAHAGAPFIFFIDSDDLIEPTTLEKCLWYLLNDSNSAFVSGLEVGFGANRYLSERGFHSRELFTENNQKNPTFMIRRDVFNNVGGFDESLPIGLEDWAFWLKCADRGYWGGSILEYLNWYRWSESSIKRFDERRKSGEEEEYRRRFQGEFAGAFKRAGRRCSIARVAVEGIEKRRERTTVDTVVAPDCGKPERIVFTSEPDLSVEREAYSITPEVFVMGRLFITPK